MMTNGEDRLAVRLLPWGYGAAIIACALNLVWLACIITLESYGGVPIQAGEHPALFRLSVGAALLLTCMQIPILLSTTTLAAERDAACALVGGCFYLLYIPINLISYYSYGRLAPIAYAPEQAGEQSAQFVARLVEIGHPLGLTGNLPILGYGLLGLAWCILGIALWRRGRLWNVAIAFLVLSGMLSLLGALGGFVDITWLSRCCFFGGVVSFPALLLLGVALWREARGAAL